MALPTWHDITDTSLGGEKSFNQDRCEEFRENQLALGCVPIDSKFRENSTVAGWITLATVEDRFFPPVAAQANSLLKLAVEAYVTGGATGELRAKIGSSGTYSSVVQLTNASYERKTLSLPHADLAAVAGLIEDIIVEGRIANGTGTLYARNYTGATHIEVSDA